MCVGIDWLHIFFYAQEGIAMTEPHTQKGLVEFYGPTLTSVIEVYTHPTVCPLRH